MVVLLAGAVSHLLLQWQFLSESWIGPVLGSPLVVIGVLVVFWSTLTIRDMDISKPTLIISSGPYAFSRNPMYVAWTAIYLGVAMIMNTVWLIVMLPAVLIVTHYLVIRREERSLEREFGEAYLSYRARVRRYL